MKSFLLALWSAFAVGAQYLWNEQRDFLLVLPIFAIAMLAAGIVMGSSAMVAGAVGFLLALVGACVIFGMHKDLE
ncbi:hypothetical protein [Arenimonas oryziterrae]|uniref:Uncharacterized protein n=1 Tax=Arenimonas oryziterrae DSM 21050 = YC6267 TaxID=1121015 RepID=A0A091AQ91_9GAMM|nr:hypothetical protein [Arenimonas oryziterrae]KFN42333.1 hypothetical protein N789_14180 [Arenimonas oryziterrae DSM 21050 = YC6267]